jgi:hypothetical protein
MEGAPAAVQKPRFDREKRPAPNRPAVLAVLRDAVENGSGRVPFNAPLDNTVIDLLNQSLGHDGGTGERAPDNKKFGPFESPLGPPKYGKLSALDIGAKILEELWKCGVEGSRHPNFVLDRNEAEKKGCPMRAYNALLTALVCNRELKEIMHPISASDRRPTSTIVHMDFFEEARAKLRALGPFNGARPLTSAYSGTWIPPAADPAEFADPAA